MTEREQAFIEQAKIIKEILAYKETLVAEQNRTISNCFNHIAISGVTSDPTFEKEMNNKKPSRELTEKIELCDKLVDFCKNNPLIKDNATATRYLFNIGKFRTKNEIERMLKCKAPEGVNFAVNVGKMFLIILVTVPAIAISLFFALLGFSIGWGLIILSIVIAIVVIKDRNSNDKAALRESNYDSFLQTAINKGLYRKEYNLTYENSHFNCDYYYGDT